MSNDINKKSYCTDYDSFKSQYEKSVTSFFDATRKIAAAADQGNAQNVRTLLQEHNLQTMLDEVKTAREQYSVIIDADHTTSKVENLIIESRHVPDFNSLYPYDQKMISTSCDILISSIASSTVPADRYNTYINQVINGTNFRTDIENEVTKIVNSIRSNIPDLDKMKCYAAATLEYLSSDNQETAQQTAHFETMESRFADCFYLYRSADITNVATDTITVAEAM